MITKEDIPNDNSDIEIVNELKSLSEFLLSRAEIENCKLYGIIDSAINDIVFSYLLTDKIKYKSLFEGTIHVDSYGVSGIMVECKKDSPLFNWMSNEASGDNCTMFFLSKDEFEYCFKHLQQFNRVYLEGDDIVLFRYYDPRVLRKYLPTCNSKELKLFFGDLEVIYVEDKNPEVIIEFKKTKMRNEHKLVVSKTKVIAK